MSFLSMRFQISDFRFQIDLGILRFWDLEAANRQSANRQSTIKQSEINLKSEI